MPSMIVRFRDGEAIRWGRLVSAPPTRPTDAIELIPLASWAATTAELIAALDGAPASEATDAPVTISAAQLLSPVTSDASLVCQGLNYQAHAAEGGVHERKQNLFFMKASSSLCGPYDAIVRPKGVELLDYEVEVGIVLRRKLPAGVTVDAGNLGDYVAGVVLCNDVSARDVMFGATAMQWFEGKSYRTFCPAGPVLYLLDADEVVATLDDLEMTLAWRGAPRQAANTRQMIYRPAETLTQLAALMDLSCGDMLLTGTPGGVIIGKGGARLGEIFRDRLGDDAGRRQAMVAMLKAESDYLEPGDDLALTLRDGRGGRELGGQLSRIVDAT